MNDSRSKHASRLAAWRCARFAAKLILPLGIFPGCEALLSFPPPSEIALEFNVGRGVPIGATGEPVFHEQPVFEALPGRIGSHAATITALDDGELLAAWYSYEGPHELNGSAIYMARRPAGFERWDSPTLHIDRPIGDGNPVLYSEGDKVWLFQAVVPGLWSTAHIEMQISNDRGWNWSAPKIVAGAWGSNVRHPPVRTADGSLLLPAYDDLWQRCLFFHSDDGIDWTPISAVYSPPPLQCIQPSVARLSNGRLLSVMRNRGGQWLWVMASDDDGASWSVPIDSGFANPDSGALLLLLASGKLALIHNDNPTERRPLSIALSADDGRTWPHCRVIADGDATYSYPAAVQTPDGLVHVLYSVNRDRIQHVMLNEAWIVGSE